MKNKCEDCGVCCLETEMIISRDDINLIILKSSYFNGKEDFTYKINDEQYKLINHKGHCVFFDLTQKSCKIYRYRPNGCRFYPLIFDLNLKRCKIDIDCPRYNLFYNDKQKYKTACQNLKRFLTKQLNIKMK